MNVFSINTIFLLILSVNCLGQDNQTEKEMLEGCILYQEPSFPDGSKSFQRFVNKNLKYPKRGCVEGTAFVSFVVNEDGSLSEIKIVRGVCDECDNSAIEVFKKMPKWIPGRIDGKVTKMRMIYPVKFSLS